MNIVDSVLEKIEASTRKARNKIKGLVDVDGLWKDSHSDMAAIIEQYFKKIFSSSSLSPEDIDLVLEGVHPKLTSPMSRLLDLRFTGEEIRSSVFDIGPVKAPRRDGLPAL
ncbi:hypothetical protein Dsin_027459 [Dipteronia sinensis]|uniref:Uncharacterized protein n=1 Tax=Dipteronia sinensis TaxID=43782 RepID=A0AAE0DTB4_9ROSI|nr:hypothetical protein Dsin_027459 [Dipteronia sinensis]